MVFFQGNHEYIQCNKVLLKWKHFMLIEKKKMYNKIGSAARWKHSSKNISCLLKSFKERKKVAFKEIPNRYLFRMFGHTSFIKYRWMHYLNEITWQPFGRAFSLAYQNTFKSGAFIVNAKFDHIIYEIFSNVLNSLEAFSIVFSWFILFFFSSLFSSTGSILCENSKRISQRK